MQQYIKLVIVFAFLVFTYHLYDTHSSYWGWGLFCAFAIAVTSFVSESTDEEDYDEDDDYEDDDEEPHECDCEYCNK